MFNFIEPIEMVDAQFSLPYCVALVLLGVETGPAWLNRELFKDKEVLSIGPRVKIHPDVKSDEIFHNEKRRISSRVVITTDSGDSFEETVAAPRGSPTYPISENEITEKYLKMAVPVVGLENALELKNFILEIDAQQCVSTLSRLISV